MGQLFRKDSEEIDDIEYFDFEVSLCNNTLDQYEDILSIYREWKSFKRDIRITSLLESGKRIQFDIESLSILVSIGCEDTAYLKNSAIDIKSISFILKEDKVEKLTLKCRVLQTPMGKVVDGLMEACLPIEIRQNIIDGKIINFYIEASKNAA